MNSKHLKYFASLTLLSVLMLFSTCRKDADPLSPTERVTELLTNGSWSLVSLTVDDVDQSNLFPDLSITFTGSGFTAINGDPVWPGSGAWTFTDDSAEEFVRSDGVSVAIRSITENSLHLGLSWNETTLGPGRVSSVRGTHVFILGK